MHPDGPRIVQQQDLNVVRHSPAKMEAGKGLRLEVADSNILTVATTLPLDQFAAAHKGPPAQVFDYQTDQQE